MKEPINLPTETAEQREIVKALIEAKSERLECRYIAYNSSCLKRKWGSFATGRADTISEELSDYDFRLALPDCPCIVKAPLRTEENGSHIKGKKEEDAPKLDLSSELSEIKPTNDCGDDFWKWKAIDSALRKIEAHANGRNSNV